ncbi:hypothetical protein F4556_005515 [Kitasatospora gansuensis]|uniref:Uncharacterized protein n=1 Tax=Kitasatospora gansuensis TaxID=258050 RepID=A0A7W7WKH3_9ACTN|nr:hypothetical protein [Kitasatospora gansuensis]MBB4949980.1 hypothetical protein [Kitasatospora gansuensis]
MGIGFLLLYAALAVVALWLIAELLLQSRAPLHWRAVALGGFLAVVAGMALSSVLVIGAGAALFAAGQLLVTLSVKRGYVDGWSLRRADGELPGPLAKVPLLSAATGGEPEAAAEVVQQVGEVGPIEPEQAPVAYEFEQMQELAAEPVADPAAEESVYAAAYYQQPYYDQGYQQPQYGYEQYQDQYAQPQQQQPYYDQGYPQQQEWQQPAVPQQYQPEQQQPEQQQNWNYQQQI